MRTFHPPGSAVPFPSCACARRVTAAAMLLVLSLMHSAGPAHAQQYHVENAQPIAAFDENERLDGETIAFFVIGDWGTGGKLQRKVAHAMAAKQERDSAIAVLTTGDNFYGMGVSGVDDIQWKRKFEDMYARDRLDIPFYATLGNHDYGQDPDAQVRYTGRKLPDGSTTRWHLPARYWTKTFSSERGGFRVRVIGLETQTLIGAGAEPRKRQLAWLDSVLSSAREEWIFVTGHHTIYSNGVYGNTLGMIRNVAPLLEKYKVDAYLCGHEHDLQLLKPVNGVQYIVSGGGSGARDVRWAANTIYAATNGGVVWLQVNADAMLVQFLDAEGAVRYAQRMTNNK